MGGRRSYWSTDDHQKPEISLKKDLAQTEDWLHEGPMRDSGIRKRLAVCRSCKGVNAEEHE